MMPPLPHTPPSLTVGDVRIELNAGALQVGDLTIDSGEDLVALQRLVNAAVVRSGRANLHLNQNVYAELVAGRHTPVLRAFILSMPIPVGRAVRAALNNLSRRSSRRVFR